MSPDAPSATPGWYPDPEGGGQRYWDGTTWTEKSDLRATRPEAERLANRRITLIVLAIFLVSGIVWGGWVAYSWNGTPGGAKDACHGYVKDQLKAPTTAEFSEEEVRGPDGGDVYTVEGFVDSQNSFGAMVRNHFRCTTMHSGSAGNDYIFEGLEITHR